MKISCTQENLSKGLNLVSHIASKDVNLPALSNVLLKVEDKNLKLCATNLEIGITSFIRSKIDETGEFALQAKVLADYINLLPKERIDLETFKDNLQIVCGNYHTQIKGSDTAEFPAIPTVEKNNGYRVPLSEVKKALQKVIFASVLSDLRPEISGVFLSFTDEKLTLVATDSYRLAESVIPFKFLEEQQKKNQSIIMPLRTAQEILRVLNTDGDSLIDDGRGDEVDFYIEENQVLLVINNTDLVSRLVEGQYPDYQQIIPQDFKTNIIIEKNELQKAIKATSLFTKSGVFDILLKINIDKNEVEVFAENSQLGKNSVKLKAKTSGEDNEIVLNFRYLLDGLQNINTNEVVIDILDNTAPCVVRPYQEGKVLNDYLYLVMPIRQ